MRGTEALLGKFRTLWEKGKFALPVLGLGVLLLLWPSGTGETKSAASPEAAAEETAAQQQKEMERILSRIEGAGELHLMLTLESGETAVYGEAGESTLSRGQEKLLTHEYPRVRGVAVVCEGGNDPAVRQELTALLCAALGIGSHRVYIGAG